MPYVATIASFVLICVCLYRVISRKYHYTRERNARGCSEASYYRHKDPLLGLDLFFKEKKASDAISGLKFQQDVFREYGKTVETHYCGTRVIRTMDKQNIQAVLALQFHDFGLQPLRQGIAEPFFGLGINTTDGKHWEYSRSLVKPTFSRAEISSFDYLEKHLNRFFALLPDDASEMVDLQPLFARFFLDTSTELLFGKSADTLLPDASNEDKKFIDSYHYVMQGFGVRVRLAWMKFLYQDPQWFKAVSNVHQWVDKYIDTAIDQHRTADTKDSKGSSDTSGGGRKYYLLQEMVKHSQNKSDLGSEILAVFMPSQDTESWLLSNIFHKLARDQRVWRKLRAEVQKLDNQTLTFESLKSVRYLQYIINETLRMYPISDSAPRVCLKDTTLPTGGGPTGDKTIFVRKGDMISIHMHCLHQDEDIWGDDAAEFYPERWEHTRPLWGFVPFGGGPRTCPAQQLVYTEAAYVVARMAQRFEKLENRDPRPWTELWRISTLSKYGCQVALFAAEE